MVAATAASAARCGPVHPVGGASCVGLSTHVRPRLDHDRDPGRRSGQRLLTPDVSVEQGGTLTVANNDGVAHTVTSDALGTSGDPLFDFFVPPTHDPRVPAAAHRRGVYAFYCTFHPGMRGTLTVIGGPVGDVPVPPAFEQPLRIPKVLTGDHITIPMKKADVRVMAHGPKTTMWTYGGSYPGPTIMRRTGQATKVTFKHQLPRTPAS